MTIIGILGLAVVFRTLDAVFYKTIDENESASPLSISNPGYMYFEPLYYLSLAACECIIQAMYLKICFSPTDDKQESFYNSKQMTRLFIRSAGARFLIILLPVFSRSAQQFIIPKSLNRTMLIPVNFTTGKK